MFASPTLAKSRVRAPPVSRLNVAARRSQTPTPIVFPVRSPAMVPLLSVHSKLTSQIRCDGVVPSWQCVAVFEAKRGDQTRVGFEAGRILFAVQIGCHDQARFGTGSADEFEHLFIAVQWLGSPVLGDLREQTMLDGIPFGGSGGIMSNRDGETEWIAQLCLKFGLPCPGTATVTAA